jgi:mitochondrial import inner membrane translocase subunit TIM22
MPFLQRKRRAFFLWPLQYRARNDMTNGVLGGFVTGSILARASGPRAAVGGGLAFAAFSGAIEIFLRREAPE